MSKGLLFLLDSGKKSNSRKLSIEANISVPNRPRVSVPQAVISPKKQDSGQNNNNGLTQYVRN